MDKVQLVKSIARNGFAWPGGYPLFAITSDGGCLCPKCVTDNYRIIRESQRDDSHDGWQVEAVEINYESEDLYCDNCNDAIPSAYGE
jgi:hypothetical protein